DAHRQAIPALVGQPCDLLDRREARIDLDGHLGIIGERERLAERALHALHLRNRELRRRAATPVVLPHDALADAARAHERELALERIEVGIDPPRRARDDDVAAAEE